MLALAAFDLVSDGDEDRGLLANVTYEPCRFDTNEEGGAVREQIKVVSADTSVRRDRAELAEAVGCSKQHVADTLKRLLDDGAVRVHEGVAAHGADQWRAWRSAATVDVDLGEADITSPGVWDSYTWALAVSDRLAGSTETGLEELDGPWRTRDGQATLGELDPPD